jgi:two-component system OmpR family sensor kinase
MRRRHLLPTSLRWRLAAWVTAVVLICTAVSFAVVYNGTGTQLRHQIDREIGGDLEALSSTVRSAASTGRTAGSAPQRGADTRSEHAARTPSERTARTPSERTARTPSERTANKPSEHASQNLSSSRRVAAVARRYVQNQPFRASSALQFAIVEGPRRGETTTATNRPELFGATHPDNGESVTDQQYENRLSQRLLAVPDGYSTLTLADVGDLRLLKRRLTLPGGTHVTIGVGERLASVGAAQRGVAEAFILAALLTLVGALGASYLIGTLFSRPLRRMAAVAAKVDAGDLHPRIHDVGGRGEEVLVLAEAFNHMLDRLTDAFASQRAFVADASHELRTPLTVIRGQLEVLASQTDPGATEVQRVERLVQAEIARISRLVDDLLVLAKAEQSEFLRVEPIELSAFVEELWDGVSLLAARRFELGPVPEGTLTADPDRLAQALRNLVSNAIEHTTSEQGLVRLDVVHRSADRVLFVVSDDGPGIPPDQRERVFDRFHRTDAARDRASGGTGLGLAIVHAIVEAHGGWVRAAAGAQRGTRIELELPRFAALGPAASAALAASAPQLAEPRPV